MSGGGEVEQKGWALDPQLPFNQNNLILSVLHFGLASKILLRKGFQFRNNSFETSELENASQHPSPIPKPGETLREGEHGYGWKWVLGTQVSETSLAGSLTQL